MTTAEATMVLAIIYSSQNIIIKVYHWCDDRDLAHSPDLKRKLIEAIRQDNENLPTDVIVRAIDMAEEPEKVERLAKLFSCSDANLINNEHSRGKTCNYRITCSTGRESTSRGRLLRKSRGYKPRIKSAPKNKSAIILYAFGAITKKVGKNCATTDCLQRRSLHRSRPPS